MRHSGNPITVSLSQLIVELYEIFNGLNYSQNLNVLYYHSLFGRPLIHLKKQDLLCPSLQALT